MRTETLDSVLGDASVDFIKIDVQGWELEVLKGMTGVFNNNPELTICFEFGPFALGVRVATPCRSFSICGRTGSRSTIRPV